jgi:flavin-binding protein dodecin
MSNTSNNVSNESNTEIVFNGINERDDSMKKLEWNFVSKHNSAVANFINGKIEDVKIKIVSGGEINISTTSKEALELTRDIITKILDTVKHLEYRHNTSNDKDLDLDSLLI